MAEIARSVNVGRSGPSNGRCLLHIKAFVRRPTTVGVYGTAVLVFDVPRRDPTQPRPWFRPGVQGPRVGVARSSRTSLCRLGRGGRLYVLVLVTPRRGWG